MISYTLKEFILDFVDEDGCELYIVLDDLQRALYVGQASTGIQNRWFNSGRGHLVKNPYNQWLGLSPLGKEIAENMPLSLNWIIRLYTVDECLKYIEEHISIYAKISTIDFAEVALMKKYEPTLNRQFG